MMMMMLMMMRVKMVMMMMMMMMIVLMLVMVTMSYIRLNMWYVLLHMVIIWQLHCDDRGGREGTSGSFPL